MRGAEVPPERAVKLAAIQCALGDAAPTNLARLGRLVEAAAQQQAQVICLPELVEGPYFCRTQQASAFALAQPVDDNPTLAYFADLCRRLRVVVVVPFFEADGPHFYNSVAVVGPEGTLLRHDRGATIYRKSHIPQGPGYEEKYYFRPGRTGFCVWPTPHGRLGIGICWDQWFPEAARAMMLRGAEVLLYPSAIGSEPHAPELDTQPEWTRAMQGHAVSNRVPVVGVNRIGREGEATFYGSSFITDERGHLLVQLGRDEAGVATATVDLARIAEDRAMWGFFRDRRPDLYASLTEC